MKYKYERIINYYETDRMGVVHHSNYIRFLEEARSRWLEYLKIPMEKLEKEGCTIPTIEVYCKYKCHVTSGDIITIEPRITKFNGVRMKIEYVVKNKETDEEIIKAWTSHCFTNNELRPINMKKYNKEIFEIFDRITEKE